MFGKILGIVGKVVGYLPQIIVIAEELFGSKTGSQKKEFVLQNISNMLGVAEGISGKEIVDEVMFQEGVNMINDGYVKCLNASIWHK